MGTQTDAVAKRSNRKDSPEGGPAGVLPEELAEQLVARARASGVSLTGPGGLLTGLAKQVLETALNTEMAEHLGHEHGEPAGAHGNVRNGSTPKTEPPRSVRRTPGHAGAVQTVGWKNILNVLAITYRDRITIH